MADAPARVVASPPPSASATASAQRTKARSSLGDRIFAFIAGAAVAGAVGYYKLHDDVWTSTVQVEGTVLDLKKELVDTNAELRRRIAALEHKMAQDS